METASIFFAKLAAHQYARDNDARLQFLRSMRQLHSRLGLKTAALTRLDDTDSVDVIAVKTAASILGLLKALKASEGSHLLGSALYAPLVASDAMEALHQRRAGKSGLMPALASGALAVMMAQHAAPLAEKFVKGYRPGAFGTKVKSFLSSLGNQPAVRSAVPQLGK